MTNTDITRIYCDGSCLGNPGAGGWGAWISPQRWAAGGEPATTNNRMELAAVAVALETVTGPVELICDSRYVIDAATKWRHGWKKRGWKKADGTAVANRDLMERIDSALTRRRGVTFTWVKGHSGNVGNEAADTIANNYAVAVSKKTTPNAGPGL